MIEDQISRFEEIIAFPKPIISINLQGPSFQYIIHTITQKQFLIKELGFTFNIIAG